MRPRCFAYLALLTLVLMALNSHAEPAAPLSLKMAPAPAEMSIETLLDPRAEAWQAAPKQPIKLSRTPPLYEGDPVDDGYRPTAVVQLLQLENQTLLLRCQWTDDTEDVVNDGALFADAGREHIYIKHTVETDHFADAFCVMIPQTRGEHSAFPSPMMGDAGAPVDLYYWQAGKGFENLEAHGRATTGPVAAGADAQSSSLPGQFIRDSKGWSVVMAISNVTLQTPLCFAVWDGAQLHRDGLKFFSLWYETE